jgi:hypothetical protein
MKFYTIAAAVFAQLSPLIAEDKSKPEYFIAPETAEYAHAGAIHISKKDIKALPMISFPGDPLPTSPQDAAKKAFELFTDRFPKAKSPTFVECSLKVFPTNIASNRYYYLVSLAPSESEGETFDGSILALEPIYHVVIPVGSSSAYTPALVVKKKG